MKTLFGGRFTGKTVLVTGHTGFIGSWLCQWLEAQGANVVGYALEPQRNPNLFDLSGLRSRMHHIVGDVRDPDHLERSFQKFEPDFVFHLAAQPLVRISYEEPVYTYQTNIMGTVNVLEAVRKSKTVRVVIVFTSDKCYRNFEWIYAYRENDPMGGYDPYSSSKGAAEIVVSAYRDSFFNLNSYDKHGIALATVRAGNVIGGGDWSTDRIIPDCVRALMQHRVIEVRNPNFVRPWQHVLDPAYGILLLASEMWLDGPKHSSAWNFGPNPNSNLKVKELVSKVIRYWGKGEWMHKKEENGYNAHEGTFLKLDCTKAQNVLKWKPQLGIEEAVERTVEWYKHYWLDEVFSASKFCLSQIAEYVNKIEETDDTLNADLQQTGRI